MSGILSQPHTILSEQVDMQRNLKPSSLLMMLQEIALDHCRLLNLGSDTTLNRNLLWVVTRYYVSIERMPRYEESVTLETWPGPMRRILFPRYFRMYDSDGTVLLRASSVWVLIDGSERTMISPKQYGLPEYAGHVEGDEVPYNVPARAVPEIRTEHFTVPYSYIDLNGHMNNTRYLDLCGDLIADDVMKKKLTSISAEFQSEIAYKQTVTIGIGTDGAYYTFTGTGEKPSFRIGLGYSDSEDR
jgi:acyl-ACP thioesterase